MVIDWWAVSGNPLWFVNIELCMVCIRSVTGWPPTQSFGELATLDDKWWTLLLSVITGSSGDIFSSASRHKSSLHRLAIKYGHKRWNMFVFSSRKWHWGVLFNKLAVSSLHQSLKINLERFWWLWHLKVWECHKRTALTAAAFICQILKQRQL